SGGAPSAAHRLTSVTTRTGRPLPVDVGLVLVAIALLVVTLLGSSYLRPYDAPELDLAPALLPVYLLLSLTRLSAAYGVAVLLALGVGHLAARSPLARRFILPILDVLQ